LKVFSKNKINKANVECRRQTTVVHSSEMNELISWKCKGMVFSKTKSKLNESVEVVYLFFIEKLGLWIRILLIYFDSGFLYNGCIENVMDSSNDIDGIYLWDQKSRGK